MYKHILYLLQKTQTFSWNNLIFQDMYKIKLVPCWTIFGSFMSSSYDQVSCTPSFTFHLNQFQVHWFLMLLADLISRNFKLFQKSHGKDFCPITLIHVWNLLSFSPLGLNSCMSLWPQLLIEIKVNRLVLIIVILFVHHLNYTIKTLMH